jgi:hypothetical protein
VRLRGGPNTAVGSWVSSLYDRSSTLTAVRLPRTSATKRKSLVCCHYSGFYWRYCQPSPTLRSRYNSVGKLLHYTAAHTMCTHCGGSCECFCLFNMYFLCSISKRYCWRSPESNHVVHRFIYISIIMELI